MAVIRTSLAYFSLVFLIAFTLGVLRTVIVAPLVGELPAVLAELPLVLLASWLIARRLLRGHDFSVLQCAAIGLLALGLLLAAEMGLAMLLRNMRPVDWLGGLSTPAGLLGLAGQLAFAAIPLLVRRPGITPD